MFLIGGGTLSRFVIDILADCSNEKIEGVFDDFNTGNLLEIPIIGKIAEANDPKYSSRLIMGIADPEWRSKKMQEIMDAGGSFLNVIHPTAVVSRDAVIEEGVIIGPFCTVLSGSKLGFGSVLLSHVNINHDTEIGKFCLFGAGSVVGNNVQMDDCCHVTLGFRIPPDTNYERGTYLQ